MYITHQLDVVVLVQCHCVVLVVHGDGVSRDGGDSHHIVLSIGLDLNRRVRDLPNTVNCGQVLVSVAKCVLEVSSDDNEVFGVSNILLVVVGFVCHCRVVFRWEYELAIHYRSVLGQLEIDAIDSNRLDGQLIALLQFEERARCECRLSVIIHENGLELLVRERVLVI